MHVPFAPPFPFPGTSVHDALKLWGKLRKFKKKKKKLPKVEGRKGTVSGRRGGARERGWGWKPRLRGRAQGKGFLEAEQRLGLGAGG